MFTCGDMIVTEDMYKPRSISADWVPYCEMTKEEKLKHPDADIKNGYLKIRGPKHGFTP